LSRRRWLLAGGSTTALLAVGACAGLRSGAGQGLLARAIERGAAAVLISGSLEVRDLDTNLVSRATAAVILRDGLGEPVLELPRLELGWELSPLLRGELPLAVRATGWRLRLALLPDGSIQPLDQLPWEELLELPLEDLPVDWDAELVLRDGTVVLDLGGWPVRLEDVAVSGTLRGHHGLELVHGRVQGLAAPPLNLDLSLELQQLGWERPHLELGRLELNLGPNVLVGDGRWAVLEPGKPGSLRLERIRLSPATARPWLGGLPLTGALDGAGELTFADGALDLDAQLGGPGAVDAGIGLQLATPDTPLGWSLDVRLEALRADALVERLADPIEIQGALHLDGRGTRDDLRGQGRFVGSAPEVAGLSLDSVEADLTLEGTRLGLPSVVAQGPSGRFVLSGAALLAEPSLELDLQGALSFGALGPLGLPPLLSGDAELEGTLVASSAQGLGGAGTLRLSRARYGELAQVRGGELAWTAEIQEQGVALEADGRLGPVTAIGLVAVGGVALNEVGALRRWNGDIEAQGSVAARGIAVDEWVTLSGADLDFEAELAPDRPLQLRASGGAAAPVVAGLPVARVQLGVGITGERLVFSANLDQVAAAGRLGLDDGGLTLDALTAEPEPGWIWSLAEPGRAQLHADGVADLRLALHDGLGRLELSGDVDDQLDVRVALEGLDLQRARSAAQRHLDVGSLLEPLPPTAGSVAATAHLTGSLSTPRVEGEFAVVDAYVERWSRPMDLHGGFTCDGVEGMTTASLLMEAKGARLGSVDLRVPLFPRAGLMVLEGDTALEATGRFQPADVGQALALVADGVLPPELALVDRGRLEGGFQLHGTPDRPVLEGHGRASLEVPGWEGPGKASLSLRADHDSAQGSLLVLEGTREVLQGRIDADTRLGDVLGGLIEGGRAQVPELPSEVITRLDGELSIDALSLPDLGGLLDLPLTTHGLAFGHATLRTEGSRVLAAGRFHLEGTRAGPVEVPVLSASFEPVEGDSYTVAARVAFDEQGEPALTLGGLVPLAMDLDRRPDTWAEQPMALHVGGAGVPLEVVRALDAGISAAEGIISVQGRIGGPPLRPEPAVTIRGESLALSYAPLGIDVEAELAGELRADGLHLHTLTAATSPRDEAVLIYGPNLQDAAVGQLYVPIQGLAVGEIEGRVTLDRLMVAGMEGMTAVVSTPPDAPITIGGPLTRPRLVGRAVVDQARVKLDQSLSVPALGLNLPAVHVDPSIRVDEPRSFRRVADGSAAWSLVDARLEVDLQEGTVVNVSMAWVEEQGGLGASVSNINVAAELGGELLVTSDEGGIAAWGELDITRGTARLLGSSLDVDQGRIGFDGYDLFDPSFDVQASMAASDAWINLILGGTLSHPVADLVSNDFESRDQLLTAVLTGQNPEVMTPGERAEAMGYALTGSIVNAALDQTKGLEVEYDRGRWWVTREFVPGVWVVTGLADRDRWGDMVEVRFVKRPLPGMEIGVGMGNVGAVVEWDWRMTF
jgi:hypothetical protein